MLGGTGGNAVNVGIGTSTPPYPLTLQADDNGSTRGGPHQFMIQGHSDPNKQLLIGYLADNGSDNGYGALQATWAGHYNTALALNPNGGQVLIGIRSSFTGAPFAIGQGQGSALADGWVTYSSRRWKTNIQILPNALGKIEQLRGVSYDLKENGKHEIGVIAEEVGQVLPEIVSWDKNGKDANGVDYYTAHSGSDRSCEATAAGDSAAENDDSDPGGGHAKAHRGGTLSAAIVAGSKSADGVPPIDTSRVEIAHWAEFGFMRQAASHVKLLPPFAPSWSAQASTVSARLGSAGKSEHDGSWTRPPIFRQSARSSRGDTARDKVIRDPHPGHPLMPGRWP